MTEGFEDGCLVRVRAQVMVRDDSTGGWVPLGGGGLSDVSVRKRLSASPSMAPGPESTLPNYDYIIYGVRISDQSVILSCVIKKDCDYHKVMPTFHHWRSGEQKFGLTFQTAADARAFDKGVVKAIEEVLRSKNVNAICPVHKTQGADDEEEEDDEVFMALNLPQEQKDSRSSSDSSDKGDQIRRVHYVSNERPEESQPPNCDPKDDTYVQLTMKHEYIYPTIDDQKPWLSRPGSPHPKKLSMEMAQIHRPPLPVKRQPTKSARIRMSCRHCNELFSDESNPKGACEYAPDCLKSTIYKVTCMECAECVCYHCAADAEGDYVRHPCQCTRDDNCVRRWMSLSFLSLFVPCLWLYPPLQLCYWCGMQCGICGARHKV